VKLLLDTGVSSTACGELRAAGHDVVWTGEWPADPGDDQILATGNAEGRIVVTIDKDFGELAVRYGQPHHGIVRLVDLSSRAQGSVCQQVLALHAEALQAGAIVTAEPGRIRIRPPH
jgi:predicted nuclease of predicted toxin-antitoxin system